MLGHSADSGADIAANMIENRRDLARISGRETAQHLRSRAQRSGGKAALACSTTARVAPGTDTSTRREPRYRTGPGPATGRCGRTFCTSIKAALGGPHAPPPGRASVAPLALRLRPRRTPGGWREGREPGGPPSDDRPLPSGGGGPVAGRAARRASRGARKRTPGPSTAGGWRGRGCGYCASGGGAPAPGWPGTVGGSRSVGGGGGSHPVCRQPGRAEQTTARPASVRTSVKAVLTWRAGRWSAPQECGSTADGMTSGVIVVGVVAVLLAGRRHRERQGHPSSDRRTAPRSTSRESDLRWSTS